MNMVPQGSADGLIVSNTTIQRPATLNNPSSQEKGGLSGEPLRDMATETIADMYTLTAGIPLARLGMS